MSTADGEPADFEEFYRAVGGDLAKLPWASLAPHPQLVDWLDTLGPTAEQRALVVGCGLGDDAEEVGRRGYQVTAFDLSPTAIGWCRTRSPDSTVDYLVADVLDLAADWQAAFDVVVEFNTIQSIEPALRPAVIGAIAGTVAAGGRLFVRAMLRADGSPALSRPWPVSRTELSDFVGAGLREISYEVATDPLTGHPGFVAVYTR